MTTSRQKRIDRVSAQSLLLVSILYAGYSVANFQTSEWLSGVFGADRTWVYAMIAAVMVAQLLYMLFSVRLPTFSGISWALSAFLLWGLLVNVVFTKFSWMAVVQMSLIGWWLLTYRYFARLTFHSDLMVRRVPSAMRFFFAAYLAATIYSQVQISANKERDYAVANIIYFAIAAAPFALAWSRRVPRFVLVGLLVVITVASYKRGAILAVLLMLVVYFVVEAVVRGNGIRRVLPALATLAVLVGAIAWVNARSEGFLLARFDAESLADGSGRRNIYDLLWQQFWDGSTSQILLGRGANASVDIIGAGAHNDFLGIALSYGLVGVALAAGVFLTLLTTAWSLIKTRNPLAPSAAAAVTAVVTISLFSGFLFVHSTFFTFAFFGYVQGMQLRSKFRARRPLPETLPVTTTQPLVSQG